MDQPLPCSNIKQHIIKNNCFFIGIVENQIEMLSTMLFLAQMLIADWDFLFKGVYYKYIPRQVLTFSPDFFYNLDYQFLLEDVSKFSQIFDPYPPTVGSFYVIFVGKFGQFLTPPPPKACRRLKWMVPQLARSPFPMG